MDAAAIEAVHAEGLATGHASFRSSAYEWGEWQQAFIVSQVAEANGTVLGWAGIAPLSDRCTYSGVGEVSVYVARAASGQGVGRLLLDGLIAASEDAGYWTLVAQIFPENVASLRLHEAAGFRRIGVRERLGRMSYGPLAGQWRNVVWLERRSDRVGVE